MISSLDISWLAGLLEGEATFANSTQEGKVIIPRIQCAMTDRDVLVRACTLMLGYNRTTCSREATALYKAVYQFSVNGNIAVQWMMTLYSLMGRRRKEKIREILQAWKDYNPFLKNCPRCNSPYLYTKYKVGPRAGEVIRRCHKCTRIRQRERRARLRLENAER